ncbi:armadillo-type protein [Syncephalis fuscata]|nr:armadillo-type protein [Syncephalis fuscata]
MQDEMEVDLNTEDDDDDEESEDDDESDEEEDSNEDDESDEEEEDDDDVENESVSEDDEESIENNKSTDKTVITKNTETVTEQASGNTNTGKYVPPHLRHSEDARSAQLMKLRRQTQGQLNRLSEANIESIIAEIEGFYRNYPRRGKFTDTVTDLVLNAIGLRSHLNDNFVVINAAFIASLYGVIGSEFGAQFVQTLVERFDTHHATLLLSSGNVDENDGDTTKGKECSNLIVLLTELYNFQVVSNVLLYDFIRHFIKHITETNVELLTKIIRLSGVQLRQEDPSALKEIVLELQKNLAQLDASKLSSRTKFMIEMIQDLKNNKVKKRGTLASQANATREIVTTLKKFIGNLNKKRHVVVSEPLNVSLLDIRSVKTKGKWWLVGASWVGNQVNGQHSDHEEHNISTMTTTTKTSKAQSDKTATDQLLALARKQNMNTDIRRSIFVILMSSEDYIDAFDRLIKLGLKEVQEREIARVLLHCCGQEKIFNPYYVLVAERVCSYKHGFKVTFQYALWDFLREMGEEAGGLGSSETRHRSHDNDDQVPMRRIVNVAKFYGWLMGANALSLVVLKTMTFTRIQASAQVFFRVLFAHLFLRVYTLADRRQDIDALTHVCSRATVVPALADGIRFFLHYFMRKIDFLTDAQDIKVVTWSVEMAREILKNTISSGGSREDQWEDNFN